MAPSAEPTFRDGVRRRGRTRRPGVRRASGAPPCCRPSCPAPPCPAACVPPWFLRALRRPPHRGRWVQLRPRPAARQGQIPVPRTSVRAAGAAGPHPGAPARLRRVRGACPSPKNSLGEGREVASRGYCECVAKFSAVGSAMAGMIHLVPGHETFCCQMFPSTGAFTPSSGRSRGSRPPSRDRACDRNGGRPLRFSSGAAGNSATDPRPAPGVRRLEQLSMGTGGR